ncbi:hypothetical protein HDU76_001606 [Blyttiomyces sp. JEL0837]|nr:hypothetical protein HDU76_001606 [Blyttiomyces sp. JEL0837]
MISNMKNTNESRHSASSSTKNRSTAVSSVRSSSASSTSLRSINQTFVAIAFLTPVIHCFIAVLADPIVYTQNFAPEAAQLSAAYARVPDPTGAIAARLAEIHSVADNIPVDVGALQYLIQGLINNSPNAPSSALSVASSFSSKASVIYTQTGQPMSTTMSPTLSATMTKSGASSSSTNSGSTSTSMSGSSSTSITTMTGTSSTTATDSMTTTNSASRTSSVAPLTPPFAPTAKSSSVSNANVLMYLSAIFYAVFLGMVLLQI